MDNINLIIDKYDAEKLDKEDAKTLKEIIFDKYAPSRHRT